MCVCTYVKLCIVHADLYTLCAGLCQRFVNEFYDQANKQKYKTNRIVWRVHSTTQHTDASCDFDLEATKKCDSPRPKR